MVEAFVSLAQGVWPPDWDDEDEDDAEE